jgi:phosphoserine phosphatase RsbU/P
MAHSSTRDPAAVAVWIDMSSHHLPFSITTRIADEHLLSSTFSQVRALDYHGVSLPAVGDGGDFFDFIPLDGSKLLAAVGDVSSHGIGSPIVTSGLQTYLRSLAARFRGDITGAIRQLNHYLWRDSPQGFYSTLFYAYVDPAAARLDYVSAAHEPALLIREDRRRIVRLERTGTVLGLSERSRYEARSVRIQEGDTLVVFTDGVPDAVVAETCRLYDGHSASGLADAILEAVDRFAGDAAQNDDRTLAVVRLTAETHAAGLKACCAELELAIA